MNISISSTVSSYPELPYAKIKQSILGNRYQVSLVFIGKKRARTLNETYRKKTYVPNVLSFPLTTESGEIYITGELAKKEAQQYDLSTRGYIGYLFIHALLHLKGYDHGATMEKAEKKFLTQFALK